MAAGGEATTSETNVGLLLPKESPLSPQEKGEEKLPFSTRNEGEHPSPSTSCTSCGYHPSESSSPTSQTDAAAAVGAISAPPPYPNYHQAPSPYYPAAFSGLGQPPPYPFPHGISRPTNETRSSNGKSTMTAGAPMLVSAVAFGSLLGITAAAAVRWLNGDDFVLFPSTSDATLQSAAVENNIVVATENGNDSHHNEHQPRQPHEQTAVLREIVRTRSDKQTVLLQRLEELVTKQQKMEEYIEVTNQSIDALRQQQLNGDGNAASETRPDDTNAHNIATWLRGIKDELTLIRESLVSNQGGAAHNDPLVHSQLSTVLAKLETTLNTETEDKEEDKMNPDTPRHETYPLMVAATDDTPIVEREAANVETTLVPLPGRGNPLLKAFSEAIQFNNGGVSSTASSVSLGCSSALRDAICALISSNPREKLVSGAQLLYLYVVNVASHPRVPRYRKIFCNNESYQQQVAPLQGARDLLMAVGFVEREPPQRPHQQHAAYATSSLSANSLKQASYWEWLPASPENTVASADDVPAATDPISPSCAPQKPWFDDTEAAMVERLKEATAALAVLKVASSSDKDDLIYAALSSAGLLEDGRKTLWTKQIGPVSALASQIDTIDALEAMRLDSPNTLDETITPQRKNGECSVAKTAALDDALPVAGDIDATTPERTNGCNEHATTYGGPPSVVSVNSSLLETPPFSGSIVSPPATKSVVTLNKDFALVEQPMSPIESEVERESPPKQLLTFTTNELLEKWQHGENGSSSLSDEAEAAMWK